MAQLELLVDFLNTDRGSADTLAAADGLAAWAVEHELIHPGLWISPQDAASARDLRDSLRRLVEDGETRALDAAAARLPLTLLVEDDGLLTLASARGGAEQVLAAVLTAVFEMQLSRDWPRLKVCRNPECGQAFADRARNRSRAWCDMATCGSRSKMRRYRARRRANSGQNA